jgi:DNA-binding transcriptional LysR family regulator
LDFKAAEELYLAQSAVSQQISRLEQELGVEVFRRGSRSVELTSEGRVILGYAQRVMAEVDGMRSELEEITGLLRGAPGRGDPHGGGHAGRCADRAARRRAGLRVRGAPRAWTSRACAPPDPQRDVKDS